jgi:YbgC/YbaW family acyl-CoA thioester hydrolase
MQHLYPVTIRETHIDSLGHVNNAVYLTLFEEARWEWITAGGYGLAEIKQYRQSPVILDVTAKFQREVHLRESVVIESRLYVLRRQDRKIAAGYGAHGRGGYENGLLRGGLHHGIFRSGVPQADCPDTALEKSARPAK